MSNYFNLLPDFDYVSRLPDAKISDYARVKNLFKRVNLREDIYSNLMYFTKYSIQGDDRPDNVAHRIYADSTLDWLILISTILPIFQQNGQCHKMTLIGFYWISIILTITSIVEFITTKQ